VVVTGGSADDEHSEERLNEPARDSVPMDVWLLTLSIQCGSGPSAGWHRLFPRMPVALATVTGAAGALKGGRLVLFGGMEDDTSVAGVPAGALQRDVLHLKSRRCLSAASALQGVDPQRQVPVRACVPGTSTASLFVTYYISAANAGTLEAVAATFLDRAEVLLLDAGLPLLAVQRTSRPFRFLEGAQKSTARRLAQQGADGSTVDLQTVLFRSFRANVTVHAHAMGVVFATGSAMLQNGTNTSVWLTPARTIQLTLSVQDWHTVDRADEVAVSLHLRFRGMRITWPQAGVSETTTARTFNGSDTWQVGLCPTPQDKIGTDNPCADNACTDNACVGKLFVMRARPTSGPSLRILTMQVWVPSRTTAASGVHFSARVSYGAEFYDVDLDMPTVEDAPLGGIHRTIDLPLQARKISSVVPVGVEKGTSGEKARFLLWVGLPAIALQPTAIPVNLSVALVAYASAGPLQAQLQQSSLIESDVVPTKQEASWTWTTDLVDVHRSSCPILTCITACGN
jgi:hypothetical protein